MKFSTAVIISASAALTSATGPDYNPDTGKWTCHVPDAVYCAGDSLKTNIIIRCTGLVGQPGNCNDNLAGQPPVGVQPSLCYAPELHSAACAKNCIVYGGSGNLDGTFPLPSDVCTPTVPPTTTSEPPHTEEPTSTSEPPHTDEPTSTEEPPHTDKPTSTSEPPHTDKPTSTSEPPHTDKPTSTEEPPHTDKPTSTEEPPHTDKPTQPPHTDKPTPLPPTTITVTITDCPTTPIPPATSTPLPPKTNSTITAHPTGGGGGNGGNTHTPIGPSSTNTPPIPGAGVKNAASFGMVVLAAVVAFAV